MQSVQHQGRNECDDQGRERESSRATTRTKRARGEREPGAEGNFIAPGAGGAKEPHVRSSEVAWDQLLGHDRSYQLVPCQPLEDSPAAPPILLPGQIFTHLVLPLSSGAELRT